MICRATPPGFHAEATLPLMHQNDAQVIILAESVDYHSAQCTRISMSQST
jgi:hypothetical protein